MKKLYTCCFTGHRKIPKNKIENIVKNLNYEIDNLIEHGVINFISGGALGFDQIAASFIIAKKEKRSDIKLTFVLPCKNQEKFWNTKQKELYYSLLDKADEVIYISEEYTDRCMKKRNYYMIEHSSFCICALLYKASGTIQTVNYARKKRAYITSCKW